MAFWALAAGICAAAVLQGCGRSGGEKPDEGGKPGVRTGDAAARGRAGRARKARGRGGAKGGEAAARAMEPMSPAMAELMRKREEFARKGVYLLDFEDPDHPLEPGERALAGKIVSALADNDKAKSIPLAREGLKSARSEVRELSVKTLGWFGKDALPELALALGDPDGGVAEDAMAQFENAVAELEDENEIAAVVRLAMRTAADGEQREALAMHLHGIDEKIAVETIAGIVSDGGEGAEVAKETFKFISGEEWRGASAAFEWQARHKAEMESEISPEERQAALAARQAAKEAKAQEADPAAHAAPPAPSR